MMRRTPSPIVLLPACILSWAVAAVGAPHEARAQGALEAVLTEARPLLDMRMRYENVEQAPFELPAHALTLRTRLGLETGSVGSVRLLVEGDFTRSLGIDDFNSTVDGPADRPVVADPDSERLNRLHLTWEGPEGWSVVVGRQRIIHDDARFLGNVGFRQNEQTFDAVRLQGALLPDLRVEYGYLWQVNRVFGSDSPVGRESADTHLARVSLALPFGTLGAHGYFVALEDALVGASNRTLGLRLNGSRQLGEDWNSSYTAAFSRQSEYGGNPAEFSLDYWKIEGGVGWAGVTGSAGLEVLGGDGTRGFATPLATLHAFQGFTDLFLATPARGIQDRKVSLSHVRPGVPHLGSVAVTGSLHSFRADRSMRADGTAADRDLGRELNLTVSARPRPGVELSVKVADHSGASEVPGATKVWLTAGLSLP